MLKILAKHKKKVTFFVVGQLYEWYPDIIEEIARQGHEIGFHTYEHEVLSSQRVLEDSLHKATKFLKKFQPVGFRAPRVSFKKEYLKVLEKYNFRYDSSIYNDFTMKERAGGVIEFPVSTLGKLPIGSGYCIGLFKKNVRWFYRNLNNQGKPFIAFLHNWQILTPVKPSFPTKKYLLQHPHYLPYLRNTAEEFEYILRTFEIAPMRNLLQ